MCWKNKALIHPKMQSKAQPHRYRAVVLSWLLTLTLKNVEWSYAVWQQIQILIKIRMSPPDKTNLQESTRCQALTLNMPTLFKNMSAFLEPDILTSQAGRDYPVVDGSVPFKFSSVPSQWASKGTILELTHCCDWLVVVVAVVLKGYCLIVCTAQYILCYLCFVYFPTMSKGLLWKNRLYKQKHICKLNIILQQHDQLLIHS